MADAGHGGRVDEGPGAVVHVEVVTLAGEVGHDEILVAVIVDVARIDAHPGLRLAEWSECRAGQEPAVLERPVVPVDPELVLFAIVGDVEIDPAVTVEVGGRHAQCRPELRGEAGRVGHIQEGAVAVVAIQPALLGAVHLRRAVDPAARRPVARRIQRRVPGQVVPHEQIEPAVAIEIDEGRGHAPPVRRKAASRRDVGEDAAAVVAEQPVARERRRQQIHAAVVVHIAGGDAHAVAGQRQAALRRGVGERQRPRAIRRDAQIVAEQPNLRCRLVPDLRGEVLTLDKDHVEIAVAVAVEKRGARGDDLGVVELPGSPVVVREEQPRCPRRIEEPRTVERFVCA